MELSGTRMSYEELKALLQYVETLEDKENYLFSLSVESNPFKVEGANENAHSSLKDILNATNCR